VQERAAKVQAEDRKVVYRGELEAQMAEWVTNQKVSVLI
jgi:hypothetical protein